MHVRKASAGMGRGSGREASQGGLHSRLCHLLPV